MVLSAIPYREITHSDLRVTEPNLSHRKVTKQNIKVKKRTKENLKSNTMRNWSQEGIVDIINVHTYICHYLFL